MRYRRLRSYDRKRYDALDAACEALEVERARYREALDELDREFDDQLERRLADAERVAEPEDPASDDFYEPRRRGRRRDDREPRY